MIIDKIQNINKYNLIPKNVVDFLCNLTADVHCGRYEIDKNSFANIDEYNTKDRSECRLEAHKKYIDIQMLLNGFEELDCVDIEGLTISQEYDLERDIMFFYLPDKALDSIMLQSGKFVMLFPEDAHMPQITCCDISQKVKKVVVKIAVD